MRLAYGEDLAWVHHDGFGAFARQSAPGLLALLRQAGIENGRVIDLGCGSGIWAAALGRAGYDAYGIDSSRHMIALARRSRVRRDSRERFALEREASAVPCRHFARRMRELSVRREKRQTDDALFLPAPS